jgi:hypothetical protein
MGLPHVRWIATKQAVGQYDVGIAAAAASDRRVVDVNARVGSSEVIEEHVQGGAL